MDGQQRILSLHNAKFIRMPYIGRKNCVATVRANYLATLARIERETVHAYCTAIPP